MEKGQNGRVMRTQRRVFYLVKKLFVTDGMDAKTKEKIYKSEFLPLINELCVLQTSRRSMNLIIPSRGYVLGRIILCIDDTYLCCKYGMLVPDNTLDITRIEKEDEIKFLLIVEKHSVFTILRDTEFHIKYKCIVITPSGYPELSTRSLVRKLSDEFKLPIYGLGDLNKDGAKIIRTFMLGSQNTAYNNLNVCVPHLKWIGVFDHDVTKWMGGLAGNMQKPLTREDYDEIGLLVARNVGFPDQGLLLSMLHQVDIDVLLEHVSIEEYLMDKIPEMNDG